MSACLVIVVQKTKMAVRSVVEYGHLSIAAMIVRDRNKHKMHSTTKIVTVNDVQ